MRTNLVAETQKPAPKVLGNSTRLTTRPVTLRVSAENGELQTSQLNGQEHLIVPAVILVEGVLFSSNAEHPALALAEEFGIFPQSWDGRPVVYNHPKLNGEACSANSPAVWESDVIGLLFNSNTLGTRLRSSMWLNKDKTPPEIITILEEGGTLEVSTGIYALEEESEGTYNNEGYEVIWRNIVPDHLAILPPGTIGACSIADGCGAPRLNQAKANAVEELVGVSTQTEIASAGGIMQRNGLMLNVMATARTPSFGGTETTSWSSVDKTLKGFITGYNKHNNASLDTGTQVQNLPAEAKKWIASKTLLGDEGGSTRRDLIFFPVVNPSTNNLNKGALDAVVSGLGSNAKISDVAKQSAQSEAHHLLAQHFGEKQTTDAAPTSNQQEKDTSMKPAKPVTVQTATLPAPGPGTVTAATTAAIDTTAAVLNANCGGCPGAAAAANVAAKPKANTDKPNFISKVVNGIFRALGLRTNELSDVDTASALMAALSDLYEGAYLYIVAVFDNTVVYCVMDDSYDWDMYQQSYNVDSGTAVVLGSDIIEVRAETQYVPMNTVVVAGTAPAETEGAEPAMPAASPQTAIPVQSVQPAQPAAQSEASSTTKPKGNAMEDKKPAAAAAAASEVAAQPVTAATPAKAKDAAELLANAEPALAKTINEALLAFNTRKEALIKALSEKTGATAAELQGVDISVLEKMAKTIVPGEISYAGAAGGNTPVANAAGAEADTGFTPAAKVFDIKPAKAA